MNAGQPRTEDPATGDRARAATIPAPTPNIIPATDLGHVEIAKHGNLYLLTDGRGDIRIDSRGLGLYDLDTRILSTSILRLNDEPPTVLRGPNANGGDDTIQLTNPEPRRNPDEKVLPESLARRELSLTRTRRIDGELHERLTIVNYSALAQPIDVQLGLGVDMADIFEVRGYPRPARGELQPIEVRGDRVVFAYDGLDGRHRATSVCVEGDGHLGPVTDREAFPEATVLATWRGSLESGERMTIGWRVSAVAEVLDVPTPTGDGPADRRGPDPEAGGATEDASSHPDRLFESPRISTDHELLDRTLARSMVDLAALRNDGPGTGEHYLAAGIPWFATLFGRDSLIAALETVAFMPALAVASLDVLARRQATVDDPWSDAEPGKILHELRAGEMARSGETPHAAYYGSVDSTPLWLILLGETHAWTGDDALVDRLWPNALAALDWIDNHGDLDGDGFVEYRRRSPRGLLNQGWKDSGDAIRHVDGVPAEGPIALVEVQGYVYAARRTMARLARRRGEMDLAEQCETAAANLREAFDAAFWMPDRGFYAMALDGHKRQVGTIGSNVGQALWTGIVPPVRAMIVADRLIEPDLFSGWGIRTYASGQPGYNPVGYHTGSIWPHDNAMVAAGLKQIGAADAANLLAGRLIESAQWFPDLRLPELFCGFGREDVGAPVAYPVACSPQAWAAAAPFFLIHTMLGLRADAANHLLELIEPTLPEWLTRLTIRGLPIGGASVDLLVHRWRGRTSAELLDRHGVVDVLIHA
jgi:glycogen debranching enzyme